MAGTYVITGGTDGIGAALTRALVARGDHVVFLGTSTRKAAAIVRDADNLPGTVDFFQADLGLLSSTREAIERIATAYPAIDGLVLCARFFRTHRWETAEGFEHNFALFYLSRLLFSNGLQPCLEKAEHPVIINVAGPGHDTPIAWEDLQSVRRYDGVYAMFMTGRLNDLLGVSFAKRYAAGRVRYVLFHPGTTSTGFVGEFDPPTASYIEQQKAEAKPAEAVVPPLLDLLDDPPSDPLTAYHLARRLDVDSGLFSPSEAARLETITSALLSQAGR